MIKYLITIILTVALCCACDGEDFSADPTLMPPATQTGANTFGCLIDGWVYTGQRYGPDHKASYYPAYNEDEKATVHVYVWVAMPPNPSEPHLWVAHCPDPHKAIHFPLLPLPNEYLFSHP